MEIKDQPRAKGSNEEIVQVRRIEWFGHVHRMPTE